MTFDTYFDTYLVRTPRDPQLPRALWSETDRCDRTTRFVKTQSGLLKISGMDYPGAIAAYEREMTAEEANACEAAEQGVGAYYARWHVILENGRPVAAYQPGVLYSTMPGPVSAMDLPLWAKITGAVRHQNLRDEVAKLAALGAAWGME